MVTHDVSPDDVDTTPEAEFAASESDQPVEPSPSSPPSTLPPKPPRARSGATPATPRSTTRRSRSPARQGPRQGDDDDDDGGSAASRNAVRSSRRSSSPWPIAFVLRVLLFQPFTIPSASMEPNLYEGDYIVVSKWAYGYSKFSSACRSTCRWATAACSAARRTAATSSCSNCRATTRRTTSSA